jgi:hypothetical protein
MERRFATFAEFYPFYLSEHANRTCRRLHFAGTSLSLGCIVAAFTTGNPWWAAGALLAGYGFAWIGHLFFEHNRPATSPIRSTASAAISSCSRTSSPADSVLISPRRRSAAA